MTTPTGCITKAQDFLRTMLADTAQWRSWTDAVDQAQALKRIHHEALPPPRLGYEHTLEELQTFRPYALVWTEEEDGFSKTHAATSSTFEFSESGILMLRIEDDVPVAIKDNPAEIDLRFKNNIGTLLDELCALAGQAGYIAIERIVTAFGPYRFHPDFKEEMGDAVGIELRVEWGAEV